GAAQRGTGMRARLLDVTRREVDEVRLVAAAGQPARVDARASADVQHARGRRGKVPLEDVLRPRELDVPRPREQPTPLEARLVEALDVVGVAHSPGRRRAYARGARGVNIRSEARSSGGVLPRVRAA